jgi:hypothetical protein
MADDAGRGGGLGGQRNDEGLSSGPLERIDNGDAPMKIYWTKKSIPELSQLPDEERKAIWRRCCAKATGNWKTWIVLFVLCATFIDCTGFFARTWGLWGAVIGGIIVGSVSGLIWAQVVIRKTIPHIRAEIDSGRQANDIHKKQ